jgi:hypothetical protein
MYTSRLLFVVALILGLLTPAAMGQVSYRKVMRSSEPAPDTTGIFGTQQLSAPSIDEAGRVSFSYYLAHGIGGVDAFNYWTLYAENSLGDLHLVARQGDPTPGDISLHFDANSFTTQHKNPLGQVAFNGVGTGNLRQVFGIWVQNPAGGVVPVAVSDSLVSVPAGTQFNGVGNPAMNSSADVLFPGTLLQGVGGVTQFNDTGLWCRTAGGPMRLVAREGDTLPNTPPGIPPGSLQYGQSGFSFSNIPLINAGGQVAFSVFINSIGGPALMAESNTLVPPRVVAYTGQLAPGLGNVTFLNFTGMSFNNDGNMAFSAMLAGVGVTAENEESVWVEDGGGLHLIAREGDPAPGGGIYGILYPPALSGGGEVAFGSFLKQGLDGVDFTNDFAIYKYTTPGGIVELIMRDGMAAPGMPPGVTFVASVFNPSINDAGQVAFYSSLTGAPIFQFSGDSVWVTSPTGVLTPIVVKGQSIEISPGVFRTINTCGSYLVPNGSAAQTGQTYQLNNNSQLCLTVGLSDGTNAIYVASFGGGACVAPNITSHPGDQSVCNGGSASFNVGATGTAALNYQWRRGVTNLNDGGNISGAMTDTLTINPVGPGDVATDYNCFVSNGCGDATCLNANLSLTAQSSINGQPANRTVTAGEAAVFTVSVVGSGTPSYQWRKNGTAISNGARIFGAGTSGLTINPTTAADAGMYDVVATSPCAVLTSNPATLTVNPAPVISPPSPAPPAGGGVAPLLLPSTAPGGSGAPNCGASGGGACGVGMITMLPLMLFGVRRPRNRPSPKTDRVIQ